MDETVKPADIKPRRSDLHDKRNQLLIKDYQAVDKEGTAWKTDILDILFKYHITDTRLYQILDYYGIPRRGKTPKYEKMPEMSKDA